MPTSILKAKSEERGLRLDVILAKAYPQYSRSFLQKIVRSGGVTSDAQVMKAPNYRVHPGQIFEIIDFAQAGEAALVADVAARPRLENAQIPPIIFEDAALLVIDKPAGMVVHPAAGHQHGTLIDWLRDHLGPKVAKHFTDPERLGLVHRLDKGTSGVLLIAKTVTAQFAVSRQFQARTVRKDYVAFVEGTPSSLTGVISAPVARSRKNPMRMAVSNHGRPSETSFEVEERFPSTLYGGTASRTTVKEVSQMRMHPKTGRTHQIRVHLAAIGHPIVGDFTYGSQAAWKERLDIDRPMLHAEQITFLHPVTEKKVSFKAPWPADFLRVRKKFREGFKVVAAAMMLLGSVFAVGRCTTDSDGSSTPAASAPAKKPVHHASGSSGSSVSAASFKALKKQVLLDEQTLQAMQQSVAALQQQTTALQNSIETMNAEQRFRDLDHAITELNAKSVSAGTSVDEVRTQLLDIARHLKDQQSAADQLHDQVDRLEHEVIQQRSRSEETTTPPPPATPDTKDATR